MVGHVLSQGPHTYHTFPPSPSARGASGGVRERGGIGFGRSGLSRRGGSRRYGLVAGGRASGARLTRCWADPSQRSDQGPPPPGFGAQEGAFVRANALGVGGRRRTAATSAEARGQGPRAPRGRSGSARLKAGRLPSSSLPVHVRPDASTDQASRSPRGPRMLLDPKPRAEAAAGTQAHARKRNSRGASPEWERSVARSATG